MVAAVTTQDVQTSSQKLGPRLLTLIDLFLHPESTPICAISIWKMFEMSTPEIYDIQRTVGKCAGVDTDGRKNERARTSG